MIHLSDSAAVVSIVAVDEKPEWMFRRSDDGSLTPLLGPVKQVRRQDLQRTYRLNGAIYTAWIDRLRRAQILDLDLVGYEMPIERSIDIDDMTDFLKAESLLAQQSLIVQEDSSRGF